MSAMDVDTPRAQPYTFDLGNMLCNDPNPLPSLASHKEEVLTKTAQSCAQSLIHQLLTACPITRAEGDGSLEITLPAPETALPREKHVPKEKEKTKWEKFAEKKGIKKKGKDGKVRFDEEKGDWVQKYGYKPGQKSSGEVQGDWIVEVDEKAEKQARQGAKEKPGRKGEGGKLCYVRDDSSRRLTEEADIARRDKKLKARKVK